jgi:glycerol 3-phosphatase-1
MPHHEDNDFSADAEVVEFSALLFDMDGTIIDSTPAIVKYWQETGREIGVDGDGKYRLLLSVLCTADVVVRAVILQTSHGRRSIDVLKLLCPERANWECKKSPHAIFI